MKYVIKLILGFEYHNLCQAMEDHIHDVGHEYDLMQVNYFNMENSEFGCPTTIMIFKKAYL